MAAPNPYETRKLVDEYLLFHYGSAEEILPHAFGPSEALGFPVRTVTETLDTTLPVGRALDLGCATGRSSFELSRFCEEVIGIDYSAAFIDVARRIGAGQTLDYERLEEGHSRTRLVASLPVGSRPGNVRFETGDAMNLRDDLGTFDVLHAANLLCRLHAPRLLLDRLPELVNPGGTLVLATPCTWLEDFTPSENWPSGNTLDWLRENLEPTFALVGTRDLPFLIRETARKFQWTVSLGSVWRRT
jgi:putative 4-mercaptohistidine N1-methyltranferase